MSWKIALVDGKREPIALVDSDWDADINGSDSLKLLHYLDPYGDTYFNCLQMDDVKEDLIKLSADITDRNLVQQIIDLADRCKLGPHTYLVFYGD